MAADKPGPGQSPFDVFISYSTQNKLEADVICARLEALGVRCWIAPRDIVPGMEWGEAIINGIDRSRVMVLVFSEYANNSPQVRREVERAITKGLALIPFRVQNTQPTKAMEYCLGNTHWLDAYDPPLERHIERLADAVQRLLGAGGQQYKGLDVKRLRTARRRFTPMHGAGLAAALLLVVALVVAVAKWPRDPENKSPQFNTPLATTQPVAPRPDLLEDVAGLQGAVLGPEGSVQWLKERAPHRYTTWRAAAEAGDPIGKFFVGRCYQDGNIVPGDQSEGFRWVKQAAEAGFVPAMANIGSCYLGGWGVTAAPADGIRWLERAVEQGDVLAQWSLGTAYRDEGVLRDLAKAERLLKLAADAGFVRAQYDLAFLISTNFPERTGEAISLFERAAGGGHKGALTQLGIIYRNGGGGQVEREKAKANFRAAAQLDDPLAAWWLAEMLIEEEPPAWEEALKWSERSIDPKLYADPDARPGMPGPVSLVPRGARWTYGYILSVTGDGALDAANYALAVERLEKAIRVRQELHEEVQHNIAHRANLAYTCFQLSEVYYRLNDLSRCVHFLTRASGLGHQGATELLAKFYDEGTYVKANAEEASRLRNVALRQRVTRIPMRCRVLTTGLESETLLYITDEFLGFDPIEAEQRRLREDEGVELPPDVVNGLSRLYDLARQEGHSMVELCEAWLERMRNEAAGNDNAAAPSDTLPGGDPR